jgi:glutamate 5-kinase
MSLTAQLARQTHLKNAQRLVVKLGTQILTRPDKKIDTDYIRSIALQIGALRAAGKQVTIVSSGAIGAGMAELSLTTRPKDVVDKQAIAAVGQRRLMTYMHEAFELIGCPVGQILLSRSDFDDRARFLNIRNCVNKLHELGCIPIVNENDTVAVDEIRFGDNDMLAGLMANAVQADALILLTVVPGLLDAANQRISFVPDVGAVMELDRKETSGLGTGGMTTKLQSAYAVTSSGHVAVIAPGREPDILTRLVLQGEDLGTVFAPKEKKLDSRSRWIAFTKRHSGTITIDEGAAAALCQRGKSLLASGIKDIQGDFDRGAVVQILDSAGREVARGLINYSAAESRIIMGHKSTQFEKLLGKPAFAEVIHRDNLVVKPS